VKVMPYLRFAARESPSKKHLLHQKNAI
jgi:hypothetical protein